MKKSPELSLVIPVYNEAAVIPELCRALNAKKELLPAETEVIFVDDGSSDASVQLLKETQLKFSKKIIVLSRNFGHQAALLAGMEAATGEYTVTLDADLQHPLELIPQMLAEHAKGSDVVLTERIDASDTSVIKKTTSTLFYQLMNQISDRKIQENSSDFRSLNRAALDAFLTLKEKRRFLRGMIHWIGFRTITLPFTAAPRVAGTSKYSWLKMSTLALDGITSFSTLPLYISSLFGLALFVLAALYALYVIFIRLFFNVAIQGWASLLFVQLVTGGFICLFLGVLGVYVAAIYDEVKNRPHYIIKATHEE